ncbi:MAG: hypothetical protein VXX10_06555, partial [Pseudomonadota bacterium]|nr:hypothetical protein [Pseudomonadota bacterium]
PYSSFVPLNQASSARSDLLCHPQWQRDKDKGFLAEKSVHFGCRVYLIVERVFIFPTVTGIFLGHCGDSCNGSCNYTKNYAFMVNASS